MSNAKSTYQGPTELESYMKKKRMKKKSLMMEKTSIKYFRVSLEENVFGYKVNKNMKDWRRKIPLDNLTRIIPKVGENDQKLCNYSFGFQLLTTEKDFILFCEEEIIFFNWLRVFELVINKKDIGNFENFKMKFPQKQIVIINGNNLSFNQSFDRSQKISNQSFKIESNASNVNNSLMLNVNENDGTINLKLVPKSAVDFKIFKEYPDRINAKSMEDDIINYVQKSNSSKQCANSLNSNSRENPSEWNLEQLMQHDFNKNQPNKRGSIPKLDIDCIQNLKEKQHYADATLWTLRDSIQHPNGYKSPKKNIEPLIKKETDDILKKLFPNENPLHLKQEVYSEKFQIENMHCGIDDHSELNIERAKQVKVGNVSMKVPKYDEEKNISLNSSLLNKTNKRKPKFYSNAIENNSSTITISNGRKVLNVDRDIVEGLDDSSWIMNLTIKEKNNDL